MAAVAQASGMGHGLSMFIPFTLTFQVGHSGLQLTTSYCMYSISAAVLDWRQMQLYGLSLHHSSN